MRKAKVKVFPVAYTKDVLNVHLSFICSYLQYLSHVVYRISPHIAHLHLNLETNGPIWPMYNPQPVNFPRDFLIKNSIPYDHPSPKTSKIICIVIHIITWKRTFPILNHVVHFFVVNLYGGF